MNDVILKEWSIDSIAAQVDLILTDDISQGVPFTSLIFQIAAAGGVKLPITLPAEELPYTLEEFALFLKFKGLSSEIEEATRLFKALHYVSDANLVGDKRKALIVVDAYREITPETVLVRKGGTARGTYQTSEAVFVVGSVFNDRTYTVRVELDNEGAPQDYNEFKEYISTHYQALYLTEKTLINMWDKVFEIKQY